MYKSITIASLLLASFLMAGDPPSLADQQKSLEMELANSNNPSEIHMRLSDVLQQQGKFKESVKHAKTALDAREDDSKAHWRYASALFAKLSAKPALWMVEGYGFGKSLRRVIELDPDFIPAYPMLVGFNLEAPTMLGGSLKEAESLCVKLTELDFKLGSIQLANVYRVKKETDKQTATLLGLIKKMPDDASVNMEVGMMYQLRKEYTQAVPYFEKHGLGDKPVLPNLYQAARSRIIGKFELPKAIELLDLYISKVQPGNYPSKADCHWRKGTAYLELKDKAKAKACFETALSLNPKHGPAKGSLAKM